MGRQPGAAKSVNDKLHSRRPALSILLLCWNHARFLENCIESVARQKPGAEIVFLDNCSNDGSFELAAALFERCGLEATMLRNEAPRSIPANLNKLLAASNGDVVALLSTDDWYEPDYVQVLIEATTAHPSVGWFSCSGWLYFDDSGKSEPVDETQFVTDRAVGEVILDGKEPHFFVGCAYRRAALDTVGGWDETQLIEDRDLFLRLSASFEPHRIDRRLVHYRKASSGASANAAFMLEGWERFFTKHRAIFGTSIDDRRAETYRAYAALSTDQANLGHALRLLAKSLRLRPFSRRTYRTLGYSVKQVIQAALLK